MVNIHNDKINEEKDKIKLEEKSETNLKNKVPSDSEAEKNKTDTSDNTQDK